MVSPSLKELPSSLAPHCRSCCHQKPTLEMSSNCSRNLPLGVRSSAEPRPQPVRAHFGQRSPRSRLSESLGDRPADAQCWGTSGRGGRRALIASQPAIASFVGGGEQDQKRIPKPRIVPDRIPAPEA